MQVDELRAHEERHELDEQDGLSEIGRGGHDRAPREGTSHEPEGMSEPRRKTRTQPGGQRDEHSDEEHGAQGPADQAQEWVKERSTA